MGLSSFIAILATSSVLFYLYVKKKLNYWQERNVIHVPGQFFVGHMGDASRIHMSQKMYEMYQQYKGRDLFFGMFFYLKPVIIATDLDFIKTICCEDFNFFYDRGIYVSEKVDPLSGHLFALKGEKWSSMRDKLMPAYSYEKLKNMLPTIVEFSDVFRETIGNYETKKETIDIKNVYQRFTADVIASIAFGFECNALESENSEILKMGDKIFHPDNKSSKKIYFVNSFQKLSKLLKLRYFPKKVSKYFTGIIKNSVENRETNKIEKPDFLSLLIKIKNTGSVDDNNPGTIFDRITLNELTAQSFSFFFSGVDTSSTVQSFCLLELAVNQDIQEKLRNEINSVLQHHNGKITFESISEMEYLDRVCNGINLLSKQFLYF